jgi:hypothetical protein
MTSASQVHGAMRERYAWYKQSGAFQRRAAVNHQIRWPFARGDGDLPLPKPVRNAILASKPPGIWRMTVKVPPALAKDRRPSYAGYSCD